VIFQVPSFKQQVEPGIGSGAFTDSLPDFVWETDKNLAYSYVNARSLDLLGYEPSEMVGRSMLDFLAPEESRRVSDLLAPLSTARASFHLLEKTMLRKDGVSIVVQSSGTPRAAPQGVWLGYQGVDRDVTARWHAEKRLRDSLTARLRSMISKTAAAKSLVEHARQLEEVNEELRRRNKQLDELSYMSSHDLQEPLRHLLVFSQRLEKHLVEGASEKISVDLETIKKSATRMRRTILNVQQLTSIERASLHVQPVALGQCVGQALASLEPIIRESGAVIEIAELPTLVANESLIATLVEHLVANALKFSSRPVKVNITAEHVDDTWILGVKDQGPGVDPRYAERIFRPFERIGPQRTDCGSGMGLAICRAIVERHGGEIWVESAPDRGAHFKFQLDVKNARQPGPRT
jgi:PAS domain S-box-containing protein